MFLKAAGIWIFFVTLAILNGLVREKLLVTLVGQGLAQPLSGLLLSIVIFLVTVVAFPLIGFATPSQAWQVGVFWLLLTVAFEFLFGHFVTGDSWSELLAAYKVWKGNLWVFVLMAILCSPYLAGKVRGIF